jgi:hypothetical protein
LPDGAHATPGGKDWPCWAPDDYATLGAMASSVQNCLLDVLWLQWPTCPEHDRMLTAGGDDDQPVWVCDRGGGHPVARVGSLSR